jgi:hypothetical protein
MTRDQTELRQGKGRWTAGGEKLRAARCLGVKRRRRRPGAESGLPRHPVLQGPRARRTRGIRRGLGAQTTAGAKAIVTAGACHSGVGACVVVESS